MATKETKKVNGTLVASNGTIKTTSEMADAIHEEVKKTTKASKPSRNRKDIAEANAKNSGKFENHKDLADKATGKTKSEIDYDNKHIYLVIKSAKSGSEYKYVLKGYFFSDRECFSVTNASKVIGQALHLANADGHIFHKLGKKLDSKESANSLVAEQFAEATEDITLKLASCLYEHDNWEKLRTAILSVISYGSKDWRQMPLESKNQSEYQKSLLRQVQSVCDKARNWAKAMKPSWDAQKTSENTTASVA